MEALSTASPLYHLHLRLRLLTPRGRCQMLELSVVLLLDSLSVMNKFLNHRSFRFMLMHLLCLTHTRGIILFNLSRLSYHTLKLTILLLTIKLCSVTFPSSLIESFVVVPTIFHLFRLLVDIDLEIQWTRRAERRYLLLWLSVRDLHGRVKLGRLLLLSDRVSRHFVVLTGFGKGGQDLLLVDLDGVA